MAQVLFAGFGDLGRAAGQQLQSAGLEILALTRTAGQEVAGVRFHQADLRLPFDLPPSLRAHPEAVVIVVSPSRHDAEDYEATYVGAVKHTLRALQAVGASPRLVLFVSSTGVWSDQGGAWISEEDPARPDSWTGETLLSAERVLFASGLPATTLRLGGIYGPGRLMMVRKAEAILAGDQAFPAPAWTNRIHRDDAARMIGWLVQRALTGMTLESVYAGVDNLPSLNTEVLDYLMSLLRGPRDPGLAPSSLPPPAAGGKRVGNEKIRALGYSFLYPDYRAGYAALLGAQ